jgi:DhnA family fructose-bisphosphate aldolase class Ia
MTSQVGKAIRLSKILDPKGGPALLLRADVGLALGPVAGLEDMESALRSAVSAGVDGVVLGPGQAGRHIDLFKGRNGPSLLVRSDWSNAGRGGDHPLPRNTTTHVTISGARHAAFLGAHGVVCTFYVGYRDDVDEADNFESVSGLAAECFDYGLPLLVEAIPFGERITEHNRVDSIKMAGRMSLEAGADAIIVPYTGSRSTMSEVVESSGHAPVLLLVEGDEGAIKPSINAGVRGVLVAEYAFASGLGPALESIHKALGKGA